MNLDPRIIPGVEDNITPEMIKNAAMNFYGFKDIEGRIGEKVSCKRVIVALLLFDKTNNEMSTKKTAMLLGLKNHSSVLNLRKTAYMYLKNGDSIFYRFVYLNILCDLRNIKSYTFEDYFYRVINELSDTEMIKIETKYLLLKDGRDYSKLKNKVFATVVKMFNRSKVPGKEICYFLKMKRSQISQEQYNVKKSDVLVLEGILEEMNNELKSRYEKRKS